MRPSLAILLTALLLFACCACSTPQAAPPQAAQTSAAPPPKTELPTREQLLGTWEGEITLNADLVLAMLEQAVPGRQTALPEEEKQAVRAAAEGLGQMALAFRLTFRADDVCAITIRQDADTVEALHGWLAELIDRADRALLPIQVERVCRTRGISAAQYLRVLGYETLEAFENARSAEAPLLALALREQLLQADGKEVRFSLRDGRLHCTLNDPAAADGAAELVFALEDGALTLLPQACSAEAGAVFAAEGANAALWSGRDRAEAAARDELWHRKQNNDRVEYEYDLYRRYGYLVCTGYGAFLARKRSAQGGAFRETPEDRADAACIQEADYLKNATVQEFLRVCQAAGFETRYLDAVRFDSGRLKRGGEARLIACDETSLGFPMPLLRWIQPLSLRRTAADCV